MMQSHQECARDLAARLEGFDPITLDELKDSEAQLLTRTETKFLMTVEQCAAILSDLRESHRVLTVGGSRTGRYETQYYDTDAFLTYLQHHNGRANRYKLRFRRYLSSGMTFLEVKKKKNAGRTVKKRLETDGLPDLSEPEPSAFLTESLPADVRAFHLVLTTTYDRITLVSRDCRERITLDLDLSFGNGKETRTYPNVVVGEIKHDRALHGSPAKDAFRRAGVRESSFSKYCIGVSLLYPALKHNMFKENLLFLERLSSEGEAVC
jgi:hypothetical protein